MLKLNNGKLTPRRNKTSGQLLAASSLMLTNARSHSDTKTAMVDAAPNGVPKSRRPNVVFILSDDQDAAAFSAMPAVSELLVRAGTQFPVHANTTPLCCPLRTSTLRGQYAHNHGVVNNRPPRGGYGRPRTRLCHEH